MPKIKKKNHTGEKSSFAPLFCSNQNQNTTFREKSVQTCCCSNIIHITVIFHFEKNEITSNHFKENIFHNGLHLSVPGVF